MCMRSLQSVEHRKVFQRQVHSNGAGGSAERQASTSMGRTASKRKTTMSFPRTPC